jgi:hypothetical protein
MAQHSFQSSTSHEALNLHFHPRQCTAIDSEATEILYGGAAGGGKSFLMRAAAILWCSEIPGLQVYLFRRLYDDLIKNHMEGPSGFRSLLSTWEQAGWVEIVENEIRFWNGSKIYLCHCQHEKDMYKYQGAEIHVLLIDELTHWLEKMYRFLRNRVRMAGLKIPAKYAGMFPRILCGANPGNIGHLWVKATFIDGAVPMELRRMPKKEGGMLRQFIPAKLDDNPTLAVDDPHYEDRLSGLGSDALVKAMRDGDWNVVDGAFFDGWSTERHVVKPFEIPSDWLRFRSADWGSAAPFSVGWWAVVQDEYVMPGGRVAPRGALVRYREWYGASAPNVGLKLTAAEVARGIREKERDDTIAYGVLDPAAFAVDGGPSIAEMMAKEKVYFRPADNKRVSQKGAMSGWDQMRARLKGDADGRPMLFVFETCRDFIRTVPVLQHDPDKPEDLDTDGEDHVADEARYGCMSRPWVPRAREEERPTKLIYEAKPDGSIHANMSVLDIVNAKMKRKRAG